MTAVDRIEEHLTATGRDQERARETSELPREHLEGRVGFPRDQKVLTCRLQTGVITFKDFYDNENWPMDLGSSSLLNELKGPVEHD